MGGGIFEVVVAEAAALGAGKLAADAVAGAFDDEFGHIVSHGQSLDGRNAGRFGGRERAGEGAVRVVVLHRKFD